MGVSSALQDDEEMADSALYGDQPLYKRILSDRDLVMDIRDCFAADSEVIPISEALGRISCEIKFACPPGFPVLLYGERIQDNHIKLFTQFVHASGDQKEGVVKVVKNTSTAP
jgi:arginine/lysine/ornithine decarboxylase